MADDLLIAWINSTMERIEIVEMCAALLRIPVDELRAILARREGNQNK
jgi:hypothetical protein